MNRNPFQATLEGLAFAGLVAVTVSAQAVEVDSKLPEYKVVQGVSGAIKSVGSDTMNNLMAAWGEAFKKLYPNVTMEVEGKGSGTAPPALIEGVSNFGPMSRDMNKDEIGKFEAKFGYKPTPIPTSIDMLAVYVHKDCPVKQLTLAQVDAIFSKSRKLGLKDDIITWGQLGLMGDWEKKPISLYGRNSASGTYSYFREHALGKGDFKDAVKEQPGSSAVVQGVASDKFGMGYSGIGYLTADVKAVALADKSGKFVTAEPKNAYTGEYPMARALQLFVNVKPGEKLDPLRAEFIKFILSKEGQKEVVKDGYFPIVAEMANAALKSVGLETNESAKN